MHFRPISMHFFIEVYLINVTSLKKTSGWKGRKCSICPVVIFFPCYVATSSNIAYLGGNVKRTCQGILRTEWITCALFCTCVRTQSSWQSLE